MSPYMGHTWDSGGTYMGHWGVGVPVMGPGSLDCLKNRLRASYSLLIIWATMFI